MKLILALLLAQAKPYPGVDQNRVDGAIDRGAEWLMKQKFEPWGYHDHGNVRHHDLVLYALFHAGVDPQNETFQKLLKFCLEAPLERTYCVSIQAMFLSEFDPVKYQGRLKQCCQFLVDNQCKNGQWSYGREVPQDKDVPTGGGERPDVATGTAPAKPGTRAAPKRPEKAIHIRRRERADKDSGDNSNSQYAALGLRACMEANVWPPAETLKDAMHWFENAQNKDGGWSYEGKETKSYGSMSAGALGCLIIYKHYLRENWRADKRVGDGVQWLAKNWSPRVNPGTNEGFVWLYYYLYAVERAGILTGLDKFGPVDWYREGANFILDAQAADGSWSEGNTYGGPVKDVCFAILFLRRATVPLPKVATGSPKR